MGSTIDSLRNKLQEARGYLDSIITNFPGFKGYLEKNELYDADRIIRDFVVSELQNCKNRLNSLSNDFFKKNNHKSLEALDPVIALLERLLKKVQYAEFGTSAAQSRAAIADEDILRLLEYDWRMISEARGLLPLIEKIALEQENFQNLLQPLLDTIHLFEQTFEKRKGIILEVL